MHLTSTDSGISKNICEQICKLCSHETQKCSKSLQKEKDLNLPYIYYVKTSLLAFLPDGYKVLLWRSASPQYLPIYKITDLKNCSGFVSFRSHDSGHKLSVKEKCSIN